MAKKTTKPKIKPKEIQNPFNWVEIPVTDMERAKNFFKKVFNFKFEMLESNEMQMAFFPSNIKKWGCSGSLMKSDMYKPSHEGPMIYFPVKNIEATLSKVKSAGGIIFQHKKSIGQFGFVGYFEDSEGNRLGLHTMAKNS